MTEENKGAAVALPALPDSDVHVLVSGQHLDIVAYKPATMQAYAREYAAQQTADLRARLAEVEAERDELEDRLAEEESGPWPEWAEQCLAIVRRYNDNDGASDQTDGVDLPGELEAWLSEIDAISRKQNEQLTAMRAQRDEAVAALDELLAAWMEEMPDDDAAQNAWADRRAAARNIARATLASLKEQAA